MLGNQLARNGIRVVIVDKNPGPSVRTKALGVQARTLEIYAHLGIAQRAVQLGARGTGANIWVEGQRAARVPFGDIGEGLSPYPFLLILGQGDNERLLGDLLRSRGVEVQWNTELTDLAQTAEHVSATVQTGEGAKAVIEARWVAGCDGAHSAVRRLSSIPFLGAPYEHVFFIADTRMSGPMVPDEINIYLWRGGFHLLFPMRGSDHWRVVGILPRDLRERENLDVDAVLPSVRNEVGPHFSFHACSWFSTYHIHHRRAERFRDRRCFLLGDAAHIHSPVGAQGMNTGLQDAYNLAWKLALVTSGRAGDELLDSFELERVPIAERLLQTTDRGFRFVVAGNMGAGLLRTQVLARVAAFAMSRKSVQSAA